MACSLSDACLGLIAILTTADHTERAICSRNERRSINYRFSTATLFPRHHQLTAMANMPVTKKNSIAKKQARIRFA